MALTLRPFSAHQPNWFLTTFCPEQNLGGGGGVTPPRPRAAGVPNFKTDFGKPNLDKTFYAMHEYPVSYTYYVKAHFKAVHKRRHKEILP